MTSFLETVESFRKGSMTLPGRYYTCPELFAREQDKLIATQWFCAGRAEQIAQPGQYFLQEIGTESVIVLQDRQCERRAFFNVCRHRGTRLCEAARGRFSETIQCPYHAWTYATDGRLVGAPHMNEVGDFDKRDYPLHPVALVEWEGFLFLHLGKAAAPFEQAFAPVLRRFSRFRLSALRSGRQIEYEVKANWKLIIQNYSECLHCPMIHPELSSMLPYTSGANDLTEGPFLGGYMTLREPHESATLSGRACGLPLSDTPGEDGRRAYYYSIFPNLLLGIHPDYVVHYTLWPLAPARTRVVCEWLFHPDSFGRPELRPEDAIELWDLTNRQDFHISEQSQLGVASRAYTPGPYSARESLPAAWDRAYLEAMGDLRGTENGK